MPTCANPGPLERCLRSILRSEYDDFEVIVVENRPRSADTARMLVERFARESRLRYVEEPRPSASLARNAGLASAEGEIVAFTDDDVVVDPLWLRASIGRAGGFAAGRVRDRPDPAAGARKREPAAARAVRGVRQGL